MSPWTVLTAVATINRSSCLPILDLLPLVVREIRAKLEVWGFNFAFTVRLGKLDRFLMGPSRFELDCFFGGIRMRDNIGRAMSCTSLAAVRWLNVSLDSKLGLQNKLSPHLFVHIVHSTRLTRGCASGQRARRRWLQLYLARVASVTRDARRYALADLDLLAGARASGVS